MSNCQKKIRYESQLAANTALLQTWKKASKGLPRHEIRTYPCEECKGFHLTSKPLPSEEAKPA